MNNEKMPIKPFCLRMMEAEAEIAKAINNAVKENRLPYYLLEPIVANAARQVSELAAAERQNAKAVYEAQLEEYAKDGANDG